MAEHTPYSASRISFDVDGDPVVGVLRVPKSGGPHPGLVLTGPLTSVKEQAAGAHATALARRGFATLAFDHRHFGESGGAPRQYEHPGRKVDDLRAAASALGAQPSVDPNRVGLVGVCAGAGYSSGAASEGSPFRAFATVAGFFHDAEQQREWMGDAYESSIESAIESRRAFESKGVVDHIPAVSDTSKDVAMPLDEAFEYYGTPRGEHPNYANRFATMSREHTLPWNAVALASSISIPTLMIHSENALSPMLARRWFERLGGPKAELWLESEGQIDFYDDPARIEPAADSMAEHFRKHL